MSNPVGATGRTSLVLGIRRRLVDHRRSREQRLAEALRVVAAGTRSGQSLPQALRHGGQRAGGTVGDAFTRAASAMALGVPVPRAMGTCAAQIGVPSARLLADVIAVQSRRGGDLGATCHRLSSLLHERGRLDGEARSLTAQARFTARAVVAMPAVATLAWAWWSPASFLSFLRPTMLLVAAPALASIAVGVVVVRSLALRATQLDHVAAARTPGPLTRALRRIGGGGPTARRSLRCGGAVTVVGVLLLIAGRPSGASLLTAMVAVLAAAAWPALDDRRADAALEGIAAAGIVPLLEVSIALLSAGATPREVFDGAIASCPGELGAALAPATAQVAIGRTPASALAALPVVRAAPELEAWAHALSAGSSWGAPAADVLHLLLRDARAATRERVRTRAAAIGPRIQLAVVLLVVPAIMWLVLAATVSGMATGLAEAGLLSPA